jgi:hypothetical protein
MHYWPGWGRPNWCGARLRGSGPLRDLRHRLRDRPGRSCRRIPAQNLVTTEPLLLVADLLYALGWALLTGVVVVVFVQIWPEVKKRQYKRALDAYEAAVDDQARAGSGRVLLGKKDQAVQ